MITKHLPPEIIKLFILFIILQSALSAQITVNINSGNPSSPFPQFQSYKNSTTTLGNLGTQTAVGVTHAEMEKTIRDAYQIMMNRAFKPGGGVGGVDYIKFKSTPDCSEGDGYAMLAAAAMADKTTFDGLWLWIHDHAMNNVKRYSDGQESSPGYKYSRLPGWQNVAGTNSATDGDVDMGFALLIAYYQWGEFMGINDAAGNPISYKKDAIEFVKALTDTLVSSLTGNYVCGDIGLDGYVKGGDSWQELTSWATDTTQSGFPRKPEAAGPNTQWVDYIAPAYFHAMAELLTKEDASSYTWNIKQFQRCDASSDWLMGQLFSSNPAAIPDAGHVDMSTDTKPIFSNVGMGEDFRLAWRTILNYVWYGNPSYTWDPVAHQLKAATPNSFEHDIGQRYAKFLWDQRQAPWNNTCIQSKDKLSTYWGPSTIVNSYTLMGKPAGTFFLNWIPGAGSPSAVAAQDYNLMADLYRTCEIEWDVETPGDGYLTSVPQYFHEWFRLLGMLVLSGNYTSPSDIKPSANMKVYLDVDKTCAGKSDEITYTINYRNYGSLDAQSVTVTDTLNSDFSFVSCTGSGTFNSSSHVVSWNIGTVPGFKSSTGITLTSGQLSLKVSLNSITQKQYANKVSIRCSNGSGWTSNEYPNRISSIMKRNFVDVIDNTSITQLHGGRPGVHFSFYHSPVNGSISAEQTMTFRLFHDAQESYINYGNYRVSYFIYDTSRTGIVGQNGNTNGWIVEPVILEGVKNLKVSHENLSPGSDKHGKWNQRIIVQFSDTVPSDNNWSTMATINKNLEEYHGMPSRIHGGQLTPLHVGFSIKSADGKPVQWDDDWSWDSTATSAASAFQGYPITPDFTDPSPDNKGVAVDRLNPSYCDTAQKIVDNILVEEWDGYTWRRVFGNALDLPVKSNNPQVCYHNAFSLQRINKNGIRYTLAVPGVTKLQLLDISGKVISTMVNDYRPAGTYTVRMNLRGLSPNLYMIKLVSGKTSLVKRFLIANN